MTIHKNHICKTCGKEFREHSNILDVMWCGPDAANMDVFTPSGLLKFNLELALGGWPVMTRGGYAITGLHKTSIAEQVDEFWQLRGYKINNYPLEWRLDGRHDETVDFCDLFLDASHIPDDGKKPHKTSVETLQKASAEFMEENGDALLQAAASLGVLEQAKDSVADGLREYLQGREYPWESRTARGIAKRLAEILDRPGKRVGDLIEQPKPTNTPNPLEGFSGVEKCGDAPDYKASPMAKFPNFPQQPTRNEVKPCDSKHPSAHAMEASTSNAPAQSTEKESSNAPEKSDPSPMAQVPQEAAEQIPNESQNSTVQSDFDAMSGFTNEAKIEHLLQTALRLEGDLNESIAQAKRYDGYHSKLITEGLEAVSRANKAEAKLNRITKILKEEGL